MRRIALAACVFMVLVVASLSTAPAQKPKADDRALPGALAEIDASKFSSLQAAIDAVPPSGGLVRLPAGTFEITEPLVLGLSDVTIEGAGTATHIKNVNKEGKPAILIEHPERLDKLNDRKHELWRVRFANFRITGNEKSGHGIEARNVNEFFAEGLTVSYHGGDGILLHYCFEDARVCDSLITYNKQNGLNILGCHDIVVSATHFEENLDAVRCSDSFNLCMSGCNVDDHLRHGVVIENTYGSIVCSNMLEECKETAVILDRDCYGITVSANVIAHNGQGVDLRDAHGCAVSANTFTIMRNKAIVVSEKSGRVVVSGNSISDSYIGGGKVKRREGDRAAGGIVLKSNKGMLVTGNLFSGIDEPAITFAGDDPGSSVVAENLFVDAPSPLETKPSSGSVLERNYSQAE